MTYKPKFYWDEETLEAFKFDAKHQSYSAVKDDVEFFVYSDCTPEGDETYEDLITDLLNQIFAEYDKEI